jgi:hypothetical protein
MGNAPIVVMTAMGEMLTSQTKIFLFQEVS